MAREEADFAFSSVEVADDRDTLGVINALERTCELEAKLRSAIQQTHPLTTTLDWDFTAADKEREALLAISEQLEYLEDKLREARFLGRSDGEQRAILLSQLDGVRRELLEVVEVHVPRIMFAKDVVREVLAFANIGDDTPRMGAQSGDARYGLGGGRSTLASPSGGQSTLLGLVNSPSQGRLRASPTGAPSPGSAMPTPQRYRSLGRPHDNDQWESHKPPTPAASSADTANFEIARRKQLAPEQHGAAAAAHSQGEPGDGSDGMSLLGGGRSRRYGSGAYAPKVKISDEDIYGPLPPARGARDAAPVDSPRRFGGVLRIKDMLDRAEQGLSKVAEAQEQRRVPAPPRIFSDGASERGAAREEWGARDTPGVVSSAPSASVRGEDADEVGSLWGGPARSEHTTMSIRDWQIRAEPLQRSGFMATPLASDHGTPRGGGGGGGFPALVGKLAGLAFVLGSVAAATMAATAKFSGGSKAGSVQKRGGKGGRSVSKSTSARGADQPPWAAAEAAAARRKAASGTVSSSSSRARQQQRSGSSGRDGAVQGPVMHVHQPPASRSFPANPPPDVAVAMG